MYSYYGCTGHWQHIVNSLSLYCNHDNVKNIHVFGRSTIQLPSDYEVTRSDKHPREFCNLVQISAMVSLRQ